MMLALGNYLCRRRAGMNSTAKCRVPTRGFLPRSYIYRVSRKEMPSIDKNISTQWKYPRADKGGMARDGHKMRDDRTRL